MIETITLGKLIQQLSRCNSDSYIRYDFGAFTPKGIDSYRGYYEQLALGFAEPSETAKVGEILALCKGAVGKTFWGYKGGTYRMNEGSYVWVANCGHSTDTGIKKVKMMGYQAVIVTGFVGRNIDAPPPSE